MRGNRGASPLVLVAGGSIPASAGEPSAARATPCAGRVYPRECGGTGLGHQLFWPLWGLSPRVRGNHSRNALHPYVRGSIPASAGEPRSARRPRRTPRVYPRECGGTVEVAVDLGRARGLSPRVRGNPKGCLHCERDKGSIPASAGEPRGRRRPRVRRRVYPRECGGTSFVGGVGGATAGLSPRVRGNRRQRRPLGQGQGSIPASAGEPRACGIFSAKEWVYPRECGGTAAQMARECAARGLSPRVRGNPWQRHRRGCALGSIPASAGEPGAGRR